MKINNIQEMLERYRKEHYLTFKEMAQLLKLNTTTYYRYEKGLRKIPNIVIRDFLYLRNENNDKELALLLNEII